jgi:putative endonuclease
MAPPDRISLGKHGEDLACRELRRRGYAILARRYRTRHGEIDIVARDGDTIVFVEVKTRMSERFGTPADALTWRKCSRIVLLATEYLLCRPWPGGCRFDVVAVQFDGNGRPVVEVLEAAFDATHPL